MLSLTKYLDTTGKNTIMPEINSNASQITPTTSLPTIVRQIKDDQFFVPLRESCSTTQCETGVGNSARCALAPDSNIVRLQRRSVPSQTVLQTAISSASYYRTLEIAHPAPQMEIERERENRQEMTPTRRICQ